MSLRVAELETLFTGDISAFEKAAIKVEVRQKALDGKTTKTKVDADTSKATKGLDDVAAKGDAFGKSTYAAKVDVAITKAAASVDAIKVELDVLSRMDVTPKVTADVAKATAQLEQAEGRLKALQGMKAEVSVEADTSKADATLGDFKGQATVKGSDGGKAFLGGFLGGLAATPIVGAITGLAGDLGQMFVDGFAVEVRADRLMAVTGLDAASVATIGRAASEAYANNWGESLAANFDTARIAIQTKGLLDPSATERDAQAIIESLSGVADIMSEDVAPVARSTAQLLKTGLAGSAADAFDLIVKGQQAGLNVSEDWLDTIDEYSTKFRDLGLTGPQAVGLLSQAVKAGARDTDVAADALKEFAIRAVDGSTTTAAGFEAIGLSAKDMAEKIAAGGPSAAAALAQTLDGLRSIEDPTARAAAAVELFGTKAEDMGVALYSMDLSSAVDQLGAVGGAARTAMSQLSDNAANDVETAKRNIETAAQGIEGALAAAFNPQIEDFTTWISGNREGVMEFLLGIANGALDAGRAVVEFAATGAESLGDFTAGPLADVVDGIASLLGGLDKIPGVDTGDAERSMRDLAAGMRGADDAAGVFADNLRTDLITNGIDVAQAKLNDVAIPMVAQAALHDAAVALASDLDSVGYAADGSRLALDTMNGTIDLSTDAGRAMDEQVRAVVTALEDQATKSLLAGESQDTMTAAVDAGRVALVNQLVQMGYTQEQAEALATSYGAIPSDIATTATLDAEQAQSSIDSFITLNNGRRVTVKVDATGGTAYHVNGTKIGMAYGALGGIMTPMAAGGVTGSYLDPIAQFVAPNTWRVVGDRLDVPEAYVPLDGSARSWQILLEALRRMPGSRGMADGGITGGTTTPTVGGGDTFNVAVSIPAADVQEFTDVVEFMSSVRRRARQKVGLR